MKYDIIGNDNTIIIGRSSYIKNTTIHIRGDKHEVIFGEGILYQGGSIWCEGTHCRVEIGDGTTVMSAHLCAQEQGTNIIIGRDCMFSNNIIIRTSDSHSIIDMNTMERINSARNVYIGDHVWIAAWTRVLKGVKVNNNSILALGSIVTSDVPPNCIVGGVPAKVIKRNINWIREQK